MKPYYQLITNHSDHTPGDCFRTCIACLLEIPPEQIPHVYETTKDSIEGIKHLNIFLKPKHLQYFEFDFQCDDFEDLKNFLTSYQKIFTTEFWFIITGMTNSEQDLAHCILVNQYGNIHNPLESDKNLSVQPIKLENSFPIYSIGILAHI